MALLFLHFPHGGAKTRILAAHAKYLAVYFQLLLPKLYLYTNHITNVTLSHAGPPSLAELCVVSPRHQFGRKLCCQVKREVCAGRTGLLCLVAGQRLRAALLPSRPPVRPALLPLTLLRFNAALSNILNTVGDLKLSHVCQKGARRDNSAQLSSCASNDGCS